MAIVNEIQIGVNPKYNGMTMFRKADISKEIFEPHYYFDDDNTLSMQSNIVVNYIEYFKNSLGEIINELTKHKYYVVPNRPAEYEPTQVLITPSVNYNVGEVMTQPIYYNIGEVITQAEYYAEGEVMQNGEISSGMDIKTPAVVSDGTQIKTPAVYETQQVLVKEEWLAANRWFLSVARTPLYAPYGIMDGIEATLSGLPMEIPNGYVLQGAL